MKVTPLCKIFPIQAIEKGYLIAGNGDLTCGWDLLLPEVFSLDTQKYNQLYDNFLNAFLKLPVNEVNIYNWKI